MDHRGAVKGSVTVVGIGAAAGGIAPLKTFFSNVPPDAGISWVVVLHLSPDHVSKLPEVLQTSTSMPVGEVVGRTPIETNHVYVVAPNKTLEMVDDTLVVHEQTRAEQRRSPIDLFFRTLANTHQERAGCVILSGAGTDGSNGLKKIKEHGGLTLAQPPGEAQHPDMPARAAETGFVDLVVPAAQMPQRIVEYFRRLHGQPEAENRAGLVNRDELRKLKSLLRARTGHDFDGYTDPAIQRRAERRMRVHTLDSFAAYAAFLQTHPDESTALMKELLFSVTTFFGDPKAWRSLEQHVVPKLLSTKRAHDKFRVWVPGCATGEEAYSIGIIIAERLREAAEAPAVQVFGTDVDADAITFAREGRYSAAEVTDVPEERLRRFFDRDESGYRVRREIRETVLFARHNVITDPPFSHLDLVLCRNMLISLDRAVQERIFETFHFALLPGGYLVLGPRESPDAGESLFSRVDAEAPVYESAVVAVRVARREDPAPAPPKEHAPAAARTFPPVPIDLHHRLLEQYGGPSVVVTDEYDVLHISERAGRYLHLPGGEPSRSVLQLVRPELQLDLLSALRQSARERRPVDVNGIRVALDDGTRLVDIAVRPALRVGSEPRGYFLVMFRESGTTDESDTIRLERIAPGEQWADEELDRLKAELQTTVAQYQAQVESAQSTNEELQSLNEELRSAAEELETSKEELQSVNEELITVNEELKIKIEELGLTNNDFQNFLNASDIATIFLDRGSYVKLFTAQAQDIFNLRQGDVGRQLSNITTRLKYDGVHEDIRTVLDTLQTVEREVYSDDGRCHLMRVRPYRTTDNRIEGVVLTFQDISARREAEKRGRELDERLRLLMESAVDYAIFTLDESGRIESWNPGAQRMFQYSADEVVGQPSEILFTPEDRAEKVPEKELETARQTGRASDERYHLRKDGSRFYVSGITTRLGEGGIGFAKIARDLTSRREADEALKLAHADLEERVRDRTRSLEDGKAIVTQLLRRIVDAQETERARIARDLHDSLGQQVTALRLTLERHKAQCDAGQQDHDLDDALALTSAVGEQMDFLARQLRPAALEDLGLAAALPRFVNAWSRHVGIPAESRVEHFRGVSLNADVETTFYRVAQEALNNIAKHAHASRVDVLLSTRDGHAVMIVEDDGVGFDPAGHGPELRGIGLATMRERASLAGVSLDIESEVGRGTSVYLRAPLWSAGRRT